MQHKIWKCVGTEGAASNTNGMKHTHEPTTFLWFMSIGRAKAWSHTPRPSFEAVPASPQNVRMAWCALHDQFCLVEGASRNINSTNSILNQGQKWLPNAISVTRSFLATSIFKEWTSQATNFFVLFLRFKSMMQSCFEWIEMRKDTIEDKHFSGSYHLARTLCRIYSSSRLGLDFSATTNKSMPLRKCVRAHFMHFKTHVSKGKKAPSHS